MTSEAPHRPGQEPGEVSQGAGGPAPFGDRQPSQDNGYPGTPDLGWAPPPPAGRPAQPAPAWAAQDDQPPNWAPSGGQPTTNRGSAQVPMPTEPGAWGGSPQPAWATQAAPSGEPAPPAWGAPAEPDAPAWAAAAPTPTHGEQPPWAQPGEPSARGAAQVPAPATPPHEAWATPAGQQDDPNRSGGWGTPQQDAQPAWGQQGDQPAPAWAAPAEPTARAAAKVPVPGQGDSGWGVPQDDPARSGGWEAGAQQDDPSRSGGWQANPAGPRDEDPDRSGGWAAGRAADAPQQPGWGTPDEQRPAWGDTPAESQQRNADEQSGWAAAASPSSDRPEAGAWASAEAPARASASVPSPDPRPAWGDNQDNPAQWTPQTPAIPEAAPWAPGEAWGRPTDAEPAEPAPNGWEPNRAEDGPVYQPAPGPGISPANSVPLPPQEQRVPGAALAASSPTDYASPAQFGPAAESAEHESQGYEPERGAWGSMPEPSHEDPHSPAGPVVPAPRTSPESGTSGVVSASASVPMASRVTPPTDQPLHAAGVPAPQPRVYGRPTRPEAEEAPGQDEHGSQPRMDDPNPFADVPPVPSAPPSSPTGPPPFPPGVPSFADPVGNSRPANGVHLQGDERPADPFGAPGDPFGGPASQHDPFGGPGGQPGSFGGPGGHPDPFGGPSGHPDPFGGPSGHPDPFGSPNAHPDPFGGPGAHPDPFGGPASGHAAVGVPGQGPGGMGDPGPGGFPPAFPPPPQQPPPAWQSGPGNDTDQGRFDAFKPEAEPKTEAPAPKVRNGRVLGIVLIVAVLILAIPLGLLMLLGKIGGDEKQAPFNPAVGSCIKQSGGGAAAIDCSEQGAFTVVSKVDSKAKCADPAQPHVLVGNQVLCLKPVGQ